MSELKRESERKRGSNHMKKITLCGTYHIRIAVIVFCVYVLLLLKLVFFCYVFTNFGKAPNFHRTNSIESHNICSNNSIAPLFIAIVTVRAHCLLVILVAVIRSLKMCAFMYIKSMCIEYFPIAKLLPCCLCVCYD